MTITDCAAQFERQAKEATDLFIMLNEQGGLGASFGAAIERDRACILTECATFLRDQAPRWIKETPTKEGVYWHRLRGEVRLVRVTHSVIKGQSYWDASQLEGPSPYDFAGMRDILGAYHREGTEWCGPICRPEEAL